MPRYECIVGTDVCDMDEETRGGRPLLAALPVYAPNAFAAAAKAALLVLEDPWVADNSVVVGVLAEDDDEDDAAGEGIGRIFVVQCYDGFTVEEHHQPEYADDGAGVA